MRDQVRIFDLNTRTVSTIPADELAPGMVRVKVQGIDGEVWADSIQLRQRSHYHHPPFSEELREELRTIKAALDEVFPLTLEQWEDGFRRDMDAEREIAVWLHIADAYSRLVAGRRLEPDYKKEIFQVLLSCVNNPRPHVLSVVNLRHLSRKEAESIIASFLGPEPG